uniref:Dilute domain-containing protein n=1 Tax=Timema shepardi TaxID=629360 RepID=A0A7R9B515_TIMSH|nr:unnamed protein product [Timema shepardi]
MALLRRCRVNAALTIQLFSQLFHFVNMWAFNKVVTFPTSPHAQQGPHNICYCTKAWGIRLKTRLARLEAWAERQGLELAADCHLARIIQAAHLLQVAENVADELARSDGREIRLEEDAELQLPFLLPEDGYSCDVVRGVPQGLAEFLAPLQQAGLCRMTTQPTSSGLWTIYMTHDHNTSVRSPSSMSNRSDGARCLPSHPEVHVIKLHKSASGMGLSIVAAKVSIVNV